MKVVQIGNFGAPHSTENHLRLAMGVHGWDVRPVQENQHGGTAFSTAADEAEKGADFVMWTRTLWDWNAIGTSQRHVYDEQRRMLDRCRAAGVPVVGYHLDRWWGLKRETEITEEAAPFFFVDLLVTADGGHDKQWADAGVNHVWFLPAVLGLECEPTRPDPRFRAYVSFVGSHQGYHPEWGHRAELVRRLRDYGCRFWPEPGAPAVRGADLRALYASTLVNVGDSCLVPAADGSPMTRYCSDRIPETLGRGGFLVHPRVEGVTDVPWTSGIDLYAWNLGDWDDFAAVMELVMNDHDLRRVVAEHGRARTLEYHTYEVRMLELVKVLDGAGWLQ